MFNARNISLIVSVFIMSFFVGYSVLSWTEPDQAPPSGNVSAPINVGAIEQTKSGNLYISGSVGIGTTSASAKLHVVGSALITSNLNMNNTNITGVNKLTVATIDPIYEIKGKKYATYVSDTLGLKMQYFGKAELSLSGNLGQNHIFKYTIDFNNQKEGSDLWLFWQTIDEGSNMKDLVVGLAPEGQMANLWYALDSKNKLIEIFGDKQIKFSYQLIAPRYDSIYWPTPMKDSNEKGTILEPK